MHDEWATSLPWTDVQKPHRIEVGDYTLFDSGDEFIGIFHKNGEGGLFQKKELEAYIAAFFGLHF